ncbi:MAG: hypothetical protein HY034_09320 [Nitrospirae bacterium]|nr:hypothetical protein [Nitrospirota bacterium]
MVDEAILNRVLDHILELKTGQGEIKKDIGDLKIKVDNLDNKVDKLDGKVNNLENNVKQLRTEMEGHFNRVHSGMDTLFNIASDHEKRIKVLEKTH